MSAEHWRRNLTRSPRRKKRAGPPNVTARSRGCEDGHIEVEAAPRCGRILSPEVILPHETTAGVVARRRDPERTEAIHETHSSRRHRPRACGRIGARRDLPGVTPPVVKSAGVRPAQRYDWSGFYIGINGGYGWGQSSFDGATG